MTARLISDAHLQLLRRYDKRPPELQASLLDESGPAYVEAFLTVLRNVTKEETVQYILALLLQMLQDNPSRAQLLHQLHASTDPYAIFLRLLQRSDWFTQDKACKLLVAVIQSRPEKGSFTHIPSSSSQAASSSAANGPADPAEQHISGFVDWLCGQLRRYPVSGGAAARVPQQVPSAVHALAVLLREKPVRAIFTTSGGVGLLAPLLAACTGPTHSQLAYEICLCIWQLSFHPAAVLAMSTTGRVLFTSRGGVAGV
jgi:V-type H+-transporting ATPase subunit H